MGLVEMTCLYHTLRDVTFELEYKILCDGCGGSDGVGLDCTICNVKAHEECISWKLRSPGNHRHPLKKVSPGTLDYTDGKCHFCRKLPLEDFYHCSICNFSVDRGCKYKEPHSIMNPKIHEDAFILLPREILFTCNACGLLGERNPYVCIACDYMIHKDCIDLPRVIYINRHDHRVSLTYHLGNGKSKLCAVCQDDIDWTFGGYFCKRCPEYAVHSKCATDVRVWDGKELEDVPEEDEEILDPYKMVDGEKEIVHFLHEEHNLRLFEGNVVKDFKKMRCDACIHPLNDGMFYKCVECDFFLDRVCANLPRRKRHVLHNHMLSFGLYDWGPSMYRCIACNRESTGLRYWCNYSAYPESFCLFIYLDAKCGSISEPFIHELHIHPLYHTLEESKICVACGVNSPNVLTCKICDFSLDIFCATLPTKVKHSCDDHYLSLCRGDKNVTGELWCDICETKTNPKVWFYTSEDCGLALHVKCVLGDLSYIKPNCIDFGTQVIPNNGMTRPFCGNCKLRCIFPNIMNNYLPSLEYLCSLECISVNEETSS